MEEVAAGVTDIVLGAVLVWCAQRLQRTAGVHRYWALMLWSAGAAALAGAAHHLLFHGTRRASDLSWVVVGVLVAVAISYMLAASAAELFGRRLARLVIGLRAGGLLAYLTVIVTTDVGRTGPLLLSESVTMTAIVGMWFYALRVRHPGAGQMLAAIAVCALSAVFFAFPAGTLSRSVGLDARSLQHLGQIPGVLLISHVIAGGALRRRPDEPIRPGRSGGMPDG
ncbi:MAG TPA: hypothetical protein VI357_24890 [Mycobacteriales bacterium]